MAMGGNGSSNSNIDMRGDSVSGDNNNKRPVIGQDVMGRWRGNFQENLILLFVSVKDRLGLEATQVVLGSEA
jgi:hypothetical protein